MKKRNKAKVQSETVVTQMPLTSSSPSSDQLVANQGEVEVKFPILDLRLLFQRSFNISYLGSSATFEKLLFQQVEITMPADGKIDHHRSR